MVNRGKALGTAGNLMNQIRFDQSGCLPRHRRFLSWIAWLAVVAASSILAVTRPAAGQGFRASEAKLFGLTGKGSSFVYVFDRSGSMKGEPLAAAKRELLESIHGLTRVQQFQIVFYNERAKTMQPPQMAFADDNGLRQAESFVASVSASGATDHVQALELAMRMKPDVIFFLTDADEPQLTAKELESIWRKNPGAVINVVEFKSGPQAGEGGALQKLADQNRGEYKYVDVTALKGP
jgi:hypothetical protein